MRKAILLIPLLLVVINSFGQIKTKTSIKGYLLYEFDGTSFKKNKKIKEGTDIFLIKEFHKFNNYYVVLIDKNEYCLKGECIDENAIFRFNQIKNDSIKKSLHRKELAEKEEWEKRKKEKDEQIKQEELLRLKIEAEKENAITNYKEIINGLIKEQKEWEKEQQKIGIPIELIYAESEYPNSAGGVDLSFCIKNISNKEIKYVHLTGYPINAVNDKCNCSIRKYSTTKVTGVGPIRSGEYKDYTLKNIWYNGTVKKYVPISICIEYMNGGKININRLQIKKMLSNNISDKIIIDKIEENNIDLRKLKKNMQKNEKDTELYNYITRYSDFFVNYQIKNREIYNMR